MSKYEKYEKYEKSAYQNKVSYIKLLTDFNSVTLSSRHDISEQAFVYENGLDWRYITYSFSLFKIWGNKVYQVWWETEKWKFI
jgi:hypothetical protein